jgi:signal transduction histidine kinase
LVTVTQAALGRFDALHPSSDASSDFNDLRDSLRQQLRSLRSAVSALRSDDSAGLNTALSTYADEVQQGLSLQHRLDSSIQARGP